MNCQHDLVKILKSGNNAILLHSNADMDCVGSAAALACFCGTDVNLIAPGGVSHLGKRLLSELGMNAGQDIHADGIDRFFVPDAQDDSSLGYPGTPWDRAIVIDHHRKKPNTDAAFIIIDEEASSCCEIIWEIIGRPEKIDRNIGLCLMAGIVADTGHLKRGGFRAFRAASEILEASGLSMENVQHIFESAEDQDMSRRISRLKGVQRMRFERTGEWVVAATEIGAFEAAVCHALLSAGADIAFAGSQKDGKFRITGRANHMAGDAGVHLGEMFGNIAAECSGEGGGHDGAAGLSGQGDIEAMLGICTHKAMATLKGKKRKPQSNEENIL